jgi:hypothetical protein
MASPSGDHIAHFRSRPPTDVQLRWPEAKKSGLSSSTYSLYQGWTLGPTCCSATVRELRRANLSSDMCIFCANLSAQIRTAYSPSDPDPDALDRAAGTWALQRWPYFANRSLTASPMMSAGGLPSLTDSRLMALLCLGVRPATAAASDIIALLAVLTAL